MVELAKTGMELTLVLAQSPPLASCLLEGFVRQARWDAAAFPKRAKTMIPRAALVVPTLLPLDPVADMEIDMRARLFYETDYFPDLSVLRTRYRLLLGLVTLSVNQPVETAWHFLDFCRQAAGTLENPDRAALLTAMAEARTAMIASL